MNKERGQCGRLTPKKVSVRAVILDLLNTIEGVIRYRYVKYTRAYNAFWHTPSRQGPLRRVGETSCQSTSILKAAGSNKYL
jgi:hypothetical protein